MLIMLFLTSLVVPSTNISRPQNDKVLRSFKWTGHSCTVQPFGVQAGLLYHRREVHHRDINENPVRKFPGPSASCHRHKHGFGRRLNMLQHLRRRHVDQRFASSNSNGASVCPSGRFTPALTEVSDSEGDEATAPGEHPLGHPPIYCM